MPRAPTTHRQASRLHRRLSFLIGTGTALLLCLAAFGLWSIPLATPLDAVDNYAQDRFLLTRNQSVPVPGFRSFYREIVLVDIDDESLRTVGRWPWHRAIFARLFDRLQRAGVRVVVSDILFVQKSDSPTDDAALSAAVRRLPRAVLATLYRVTPSDALVVDPPLAEPQGTLPNVLVGAVGVQPDRDGIVRHVPGVIPLPDRSPLPSLDTAAYVAWQGQGMDSIRLEAPHTLRVADRLIPVRHNQIRIDWPLPDLRRFEVPQTYREAFPLCEVVPFATALSLSDRSMRKVFGDRIVVLGARAQAFKEDVKRTPLGDVPGLVLHACVLISLMEGRFLREVPHWVDLGVFLVSALILAWAVARIHPLAAALLAAALYVGWVGIARWLFLEHQIVVSVAAPAMNSAVFVVLLLYEYGATWRDRAHIRSVFGSYLSPDVVDLLVEAERAGRLGLEGRREKVTVFFSDVRSFTAFAEVTTPEEVVRTLNEYFGEIAEVALQHGGYIDKYGGDSMMVIFSAPMPRPDDPVRAVDAAWTMQRRLADLNDRRAAQGLPRLETGIGVVSGEAILGNLGSSHKKNYTAIGDDVNLAARLCEAAAGGQILVCGQTSEAIRERFATRPLPPLTVKGKRSAVDAYEVLGPAPVQEASPEALAEPVPAEPVESGPPANSPGRRT